MKSLRKTYSEILKLRFHAEELIKADIIRVCESKQWQFNSYRCEFERLSDGNEIKETHPTVRRIRSLIKEYEDNAGLFDPQWFYHPTEWKTWIDSAVKEIKLIKRKHKV